MKLLDRTRATGWSLVAVQGVLLVALISLGGSDDWPTPSWLHQVGTAVVAIGLVIVAVGGTRLGRLLTATPIPKAGGALVTDGLYRWVRHPIYTGVLIIVVGLVAPSGRWLTLIVGCVTVAFFFAKSAWEEQRLADQYPDYAEYQRSTPRFVPRLRD
jgi:protein-S-isoprenylcysteine O-methyltransferase Ste14